jgi:hypothetical protein
VKLFIVTVSKLPANRRGGRKSMFGNFILSFDMKKDHIAIYPSEMIIL